jgi:hypothetical protein
MSANLFSLVLHRLRQRLGRDAIGAFPDALPSTRPGSQESAR